MKKSTSNPVILVPLAFVVLASSGCGMFGGKGKKGAKEKYGTESTLSEGDLATQREERFGGGSIPTAEGEGLFRDILFEYASAVISDQGHQDISANVATLQSNPTLRVQLEGHTDERGTEEYNLTLGQARARAVRDVLVSMGIPASRIETISYGENVPLDPGHEDSAWARNRRVHFSGLSGGGGAGASAGGESAY